MTQATAGVDLGGTKIQAVVVCDGDVVGQARHPTPNTDAVDVVAEIVASVHSALDDAGHGPLGPPAPSPSGRPGSVDVAHGPRVEVPQRPGLHGRRTPRPDRERLVRGDPRVWSTTTYGPRSWASSVEVPGRPFRNFLGVFVGTGVGGGLILEGELSPRTRQRRGDRPHHGQAGRPALRMHAPRVPRGLRRSTVDRTDGPLRVEKGKKTKLFEIMDRKGRDRVTSSVIADALDEKDRLTIELIDEAVGHARAGTRPTRRTWSTSRPIIVGGGLGDRLGEPFVPPGRARHQHEPAVPRAPSRWSSAPSWRPVRRGGRHRLFFFFCCWQNGRERRPPALRRLPRGRPRPGPPDRGPRGGPRGRPRPHPRLAAGRGPSGEDRRGPTSTPSRWWTWWTASPSP